MKRRQDAPAECDMCVGNRQLLEQILADMAEVKRAVTAKPLRIEVIDARGAHDADT